MIAVNSKLPGIGTNIFSIMSKLALEHNAINLSQGFPDFPCDPKLIDEIATAFGGNHNQYAPMPGIPALRERIAEKAAQLYNANYDPETEVTVTAGGTQAIFTAIAATINPGDEVIIFEPAYDCYAPTVRLFGGLVKSYDMSPPDYSIDWDMVKKLFSVNTRMIIINTPHNPTGSIFSAEDINELIKITTGTDILILSDEVYEHIIFDGQKHLSLAMFPELKERTFVVASFGKLLHATGWKVGYCMAGERLMTEFRKVHQFNVFSVNTPLQVAIAKYLENSANYLGLSKFFQNKRDLFKKLLEPGKFKLLPCNGSYFQCVSYDGITDESDKVFAERLVKETGVAGIPVSAFYQKATDHKILRFCFAKSDETLQQAAKKLLTV